MAYSLGRGLQGGISGAAAGSGFGPIGAIGGGIAGLLGGFGGDDYSTKGYDEAGQILGSIPSQIKGYYDPYINAGKSAIPGYQDIMSQLLKDPTQIMKMLGQGYQKSPGYDWNLQQGENAITNASAAGGMLGTPQHQQQAGQLATNLASQDYNQYMQNIMKMFGMGAEGTSGLIDQGGKMSSDLASNIAQALAGQAQLKYASQANENQYNGQNAGGGFGDLMGMFGSGGGGADMLGKIGGAFGYKPSTGTSRGG